MNSHFFIQFKRLPGHFAILFAVIFFSDVIALAQNNDARNGEFKFTRQFIEPLTDTLITTGNDTTFESVESLHFELNLSESQKGEVSVSGGSGTFKFLIMNNNRQLYTDSLYGRKILEVATLDVNEDRTEELFVVTEDGGTGERTYTLTLIYPGLKTMQDLSLSFSKQVTEAVPKLRKSSNYMDSELSRGRRFLDQVKYRFGYISKAEADRRVDDPELAVYHWARFNDTLKAGKMDIRKYPGRYSGGGSVNDRLTHEEVVYTAYFKGPVIGRDTTANEFFVLYHPHSFYSWPTVLGKKDSYLIIGTRGEGIVIVDLDNFYLKRYYLGSNIHRSDTEEYFSYDVQKITFNEDHILVNGEKKIPWPPVK